MKRSRLIMFILLSISVLGALLVVRPLAGAPVGSKKLNGLVQEDPPDAARKVQTAWQRAKAVGTYRYASTIEQTTWPVLRLENVGLSPTTERLYIEGNINVSDETLEMKLWSGGGSAATGEDGITLRVEGDRAWARAGDSDWQALEDNVTGLFAPGSDPMAYIVAATEVAYAGTETRESPLAEEGTVTFERYTFQLDGPAFATYIRDQLETALHRKGELPPGLELDTPRIYVEMMGEGEIWIDHHGMPLRLDLFLKFPPQGLERIETNLTTDFTFQANKQHPMANGESQTSNLRSPFSDLQFKIANPKFALSLGLFTSIVSLLIFMVMHANSRKVYATLAIAVIVSMVVTPLLRNHHVYAFYRKQAIAQAKAEQEQETRQKRREADAALAADTLDPRRDPLAVEQQVRELARTSGQSLPDGRGEADVLDPQAIPQNPQSQDSDLDGLTDEQEALLGTDPNDADTDDDGLDDGAEILQLGTDARDVDTDKDGLKDGTEVEGAWSAGALWYLDPNDADSNGDGQLDSIECSFLPPSEDTPDGELICPDTDGDGDPDVFDIDDDGDGVPDTFDAAPTQQLTEIKNQIFEFKLDGLQVDRPVYVDFQLRPTDADHLWYALNVLDWPSGDKQGQIKRVHDTVFGASGRDANGDMRLIPMLELEIPYDATSERYGHLPLKSSVLSVTQGLTMTEWLDTDQMHMFGISVQKKDEQGTAMLAYVPLTLVEDQTGAPVAFSGRMFYEPSAGNLSTSQHVRLVWMIQMKTNACSFQCEDDNRWHKEALTIVKTYYDDWFLTGLTVREDHGLKVGAVFEDPASTIEAGYGYEMELWGLAWGLVENFVGGHTGVNDQRLTLDDVKTRFGITNTVPLSDRWGITSTFHVETKTYPHQLHIGTYAMEEVPEILQEHFITYTHDIPNPTLLFLSEETFRRTSLEDPNAVVAQSGVYHISIENESELVLASMNWAPYEHTAGGWKSVPVQNYLARLEGHLRTQFDVGESQLDADERSMSADTAAQILTAGSFYLALFTGVGGIVEVDAEPLSKIQIEAKAKYGQTKILVVSLNN